MTKVSMNMYGIVVSGTTRKFTKTYKGHMVRMIV